VLVTAPLIPFFMALIGMAAGKVARRNYMAMGRMSAHFMDILQGITTLKLFNRSRHQIQTIARITDNFRETTMGVLRVAFLSAFTLELLATLSVAVVAVEIGLRLIAGTMAFEQALFLLVIAPEFYLPLRALGVKFHAGTEGAAAATRIYEVLETPLPQKNYCNSNRT
jgi:ATP-binding cassette subfamily C protein CydD